jgi:CRP/FNR family transcriptional regulator, anaerobic regulatory protein
MLALEIKLKNILNIIGFEPELREEIWTSGNLKKVRAGEFVAGAGSPVTHIPIVIEGTIRIFRQGDYGNEVILYYIKPGQTCSLAITCYMGSHKTRAGAIAEENTEIWSIPGHLMDQWVIKYQGFRKFVFQSYQTRFDEILSTVDGISFMNLDARLYKYLLDKKNSNGNKIIKKTHQQIANELNTSRVVISRALKMLEHNQKIEQHRNWIELY